MSSGLSRLNKAKEQEKENKREPFDWPGHGLHHNPKVTKIAQDLRIEEVKRRTEKGRQELLGVSLIQQRLAREKGNSSNRNTNAFYHMLNAVEERRRIEKGQSKKKGK